MCARIGVARIFGVTRVGASRSPAWKSASASFVTAKSEIEQAARIVEAYPGGGIWTSLILLWISRSMPDRTCNRSYGMPIALPSGRIRNGSRQARHSPNLARRQGGDQGRPADDRQAAALGSRPAGFMSSFPGAGQEIGRAAAGHGERAGGPGRKAPR